MGCTKCICNRWVLYDFSSLCKSFTDLYGITARAADYAVSELKKRNIMNQKLYFAMYL